tara:strand:+ start:200 stop:529 length:330 start_codon:yes stop_codon:yes gene_type:complete
MPGKSKKGGGLEVGSAYKKKGSPMYKMKGFSGFGNESPLTKKTEKTDVAADSDVAFEKSQSKLWKTDERLAYIKAMDRQGMYNTPSDSTYAAGKGYKVKSKTTDDARGY